MSTTTETNTTQISQKEFVYLCIVKHVGKIESGQSAAAVIDREGVRSAIVNDIVQAFLSGEVAIKSKKYESMDEKLLYEYASSLLLNWLKKDPRLNGGQVYSRKQTKKIDYMDFILGPLAPSDDFAVAK